MPNNPFSSEPAFEVTQTLEPPWPLVAAIALGDAADLLKPPDVFVLVRNGVTPFLRFDIHQSNLEYNLKTEIEFWRGWFVIGFGARVVLVSSRDRAQKTIALSDATPPDSLDYFCGIECDQDNLLVCSGRRVFRIDAEGTVLWKSPEVGLDGVIAYLGLAEPDIIRGQGEWDPPDGWRDFEISLATGQLIVGGDPW